MSGRKSKKSTKKAKSSVEVVWPGPRPAWAKPEETVNFTLRLPRPLWELVNRAGAKQDLSMQQVIVRALNEYTEKYVAGVKP